MPPGPGRGSKDAVKVAVMPGYPGCEDEGTAAILKRRDDSCLGAAGGAKGVGPI